MKAATKAEERALNAAQLIEQGKELLQKHTHTHALVSTTEDIMKDEPIFMSTCVFILSVILEIAVSWEMYRQIASSNAPRLETILTYSMGLIIVGWAAITAYYLSKKCKKSLFDLERKRLEKSGLGAEEAFEMTTQKSEKQFNIGLLLATLLLATVVLISNGRILFLKEISDQATFSWFDTLLPVLFVGLEIYFGFYVGYVWFILTSYAKYRSYEKALKRCKHQISQETKMAVIHYDEAIANKEKFTPSKHLQDAIFRWNNLSIEHENYFEPISQPFMLNGMDKKQLTV